MQLYDGVAFITARPMTMVLLCVAVLLVLLPSLRAKQAKIKSKGIADGD